MALLTVVLIVVIALSVLAVAVYWFWKKHSPSVHCQKLLVPEGSKVIIQAGQEFQEIVLEDGEGKSAVCFVRSHVRAGDRLEFVYPASTVRARVRLRSSDATRTIEVEPQ